MAVARRGVGRRAATAGLLGVLLVLLVLALPGLQPVVSEVREMNPWWITAAVALELASSLSYVVLFRLFFDRVAAPDGRALAWTSIGLGGPAARGRDRRIGDRRLADAPHRRSN
jgi:hypothetical protein